MCTVIISFFYAKAHIKFHWCFQNGTSYMYAIERVIEVDINLLLSLFLFSQKMKLSKSLKELCKKKT